MNHQTKTRLMQTLVLSFLSMVTLYFSFHLAVGEHSWFSLREKKNIYKQAIEQLADLKNRRNYLETQIKGLQEGSLDLDLLDEHARKTLGYSKPDEKVILGPLHSKKPRNIQKHSNFMRQPKSSQFLT